MSSSYRVRNTVLILIGVVVLLLKSWLSDSLSDFAFSYLGNLSVSFALYYMVGLAALDKLNRALCAIIALLMVQTFEATNGFGVMTNVHDNLDYVANALGVGLAVAVDAVSSRLSRVETETSE